MINLLAIGKYILMQFPGIDPKIHNVNKSTDINLRCVNIHELNGPGRWFPIRVITLTFNAERNMDVIEKYKKATYKEYPQMETTAQGCHWSLVIGHWGEGFLK